MTREELLNLPVAVDVPTAGRALGLSRTTAYRLAQQGQLPVPVLKLGRALRVTRASLLNALGVAENPTGPHGNREGQQTGGTETPRVTRLSTSDQNYTGGGDR